MRHVAFVMLLLVGSLAYAQQNGQFPTTPPTVPPERNPSKQMPPDTKAPPPSGVPTSGEVQQQINKKLSEEPRLSPTSVRYDVNDKSVLVSGTVGDEQQHDLALRLARSYAGTRKVEDYVKVQGTKEAR